MVRTDRPGSNSNEQGREWLDDTLNKAYKLRERWDNRITLENLALSESYLKAETLIHAHLRPMFV
jgi:hypothetical protein